MKKMFSCSSNQVAVESWNKHDQKLFDAVEKGDVGRVSALASKKTATPTKLNALGQSAFHLAASKGLTECLTILLTHGAEVNSKNDDGSTALHLATIACQPQCVKVLLQHGANEDCVDGENRTPLHWAAFSGCASSVLLLCDQEAFLDVMDNNGQTPLMVAAQGNHAAICSQLLQRESKVDLTDKDGKTALILACERGSMEAAELLLQNGANVGLVDKTGHNALHYATKSKNRPLKRLLRSALKKSKKRESGLDCWSETGSQVLTESGKDTDVSSLALQSERGEDSDEEDEEENAELREWRSRYREEKMRVIQLELQLAQKTKECVTFSEGCKSIKERVWDQVQEINQLLPEGKNNTRDWEELSKRYSCDLSEEDYYLKLLAEQVQELKRRKVEHEEQEKQHVETQTAELEKEELKSVMAQEKRIRWPGEEEEEEKKKQQKELRSLQAEVSVALEEKASAVQRVQEMEGHMENMRAVINVYEAKKKSQGGMLKALEARVAELDSENQQLRSLLAMNLGEAEKAGKQETGFPRDKVSQFFTEMEEEYSRVQKENSIVMSENEALKKEADEAIRINLQFQAVPSATVRRSVTVWKKVVMGLENALAKLHQVNSRLLEKVRPLREAIVASQSGVMVNGTGHQEKEPGKVETEKNQLHEETPGQVKLRVKPDRGDNKARSSRRSSDLEKEVWDLKQNNGDLVKELAHLSREREKLQEELHGLFHPKEEPPQKEAMGSLVVEELRRTIDSLNQQLLAEKEESKRLQMKLEAQRKEMVVVRDSFMKQVTKEGSNVGNENLGNNILRELHWKLDNVVKKQNEALQLVSEMEEENHVLGADRTHFAEHNGLNPFAAEEKAWREMYAEASDAIADNWKVRQRMNELEKGLQGLKELYEAAQASLLGRGEEGATMKQLIDQLTIKMAELRHEEEEALRKHEKVRGMLSLRAQALGEQLSALQEKYEKVSGESTHHKEALNSERQRNKELLAESAEHEEEVDELRGKSQRLEISVDKLNRKVEELTKTCQDREGRVKKLLKETEKLSSEVLNLRSERARLHLQIEVIQKNHQEIVSIYRTHLLNAAQDLIPLWTIIREEEHWSVTSTARNWYTPSLPGHKSHL
ncbi:ankyrin repeat domain-containing protein 35 isoform X1 [Sphaerodactylus townsendi]|uniref:ankyrin repeat domain-containing protein 35 isoform X1 n=1 Tax=Sphaerodactylus townsendi TaxID=933632 RepID=UPI002025E450|nr:ankyrin repeat domain-containing protein 35 isoform X1 [Sphaerodactylus townsendi]